MGMQGRTFSELLSSLSAAETSIKYKHLRKLHNFQVWSPAASSVSGIAAGARLVGGYLFGEVAYEQALHALNFINEDELVQFNAGLPLKWLPSGACSNLHMPA